MEIQHALQCRVDASGPVPHPGRSNHCWTIWLLAARDRCWIDRSLTGRLCNKCLLDLRDDTGWDNEYEAWLLRRLGFTGHNGSRLDLTAA